MCGLLDGRTVTGMFDGKVTPVMIGLECCSADMAECQRCPYSGKSTPKVGCETLLMRDAYSIINGQQSGIAGIRKDIKNIEKNIEVLLR